MEFKARFPRFFTLFRGVYFLMTGNTKGSVIFELCKCKCKSYIFTVVTLSRSKMESPSRTIKS